jgi:hypothetical protein
MSMSVPALDLKRRYINIQYYLDNRNTKLRNIQCLESLSLANTNKDTNIEIELRTRPVCTVLSSGTQHRWQQ